VIDAPDSAFAGPAAAAAIMSQDLTYPKPLCASGDLAGWL
jgi:hypothetical protein